MNSFQLIDLEQTIREINLNEEDGIIVIDSIDENMFTFYYLSFKFIVWTKYHNHIFGSNAIILILDGSEDCFKCNFDSIQSFKNKIRDVFNVIGWGDDDIFWDIVNLHDI